MFLIKLLINKEFLSAIIGGAFVLLGTVISFGFQRKIENNKQRNNLKNFLTAMLTELEALMKKGEEVLGSIVEADNSKNSDNCAEVNTSKNPKFFQYYSSEDYFIIYNKNASIIGDLTDEKLRKNIVKIYIDLKSFSDSLKLYKENFDRYYNSLLLSFETAPLRLKREATVKANTEVLNDSLKAMKNQSKVLKEVVHKLIADIKSSIENNNF